MRPPSRQPGTLSCITVNVNGLNAPAKRRVLVSRLLELRVAVTVLCETHCGGEDQALGWVQDGAGPGRPWLGPALWSHGTGRARGVAVLLTAQVAVEQPTVRYRDSEGRLLMVDFADHFGGHWNVLAVYAPVEPEARTAFFQGPFAAACAAKAQGATLLVAGDFNCVVEVQDLQALPGANPAQNSRLVGGEPLLVEMAAHGLSDVWRQQNPGVYEYTRFTSSQPGVTAGRTSRWLVDQAVLGAGWDVSCEHLPGDLPGDHHAVRLSVRSPAVPLWGDGHWVFPLYLLAVPAFVEATRTTIQRVLAEQQPGCPAVLTWEDLKGAIQHHTQAFSFQHAAQQRAERDRLQREAATWNSVVGMVPGDQQAMQQAVQSAQRLQDHDLSRVSAGCRALGALWDTYGEQGTHWFHRLGKPPPTKSAIFSLADPQAGQPADLNTAQGVTRAQSLVADFYSGDSPTGLYRSRGVDVAAQDLMLGSLDATLSAQAERACLGPNVDGSLTSDELLAALKAAPRGKAPGMDGLPYEFYLAFWELLVGPMLAAFNEPFLSDDVEPLLGDTSRLGVVIMLHKGAGKPRDDLANYRPITLLNCDVKLVAKVMVQRWGVPLSTVVDTTQTAFVPGRWIGDNVLFHLEAVEYFPAVGASHCMVGIDFEKAYDRVDRGWLWRCMAGVGLPPAAVRWAKLLLAGTEGVAVFNGHDSARFPILAGCAQGSPLSPLLYVVAAQPLASRCRQLVLQGRVRPLLLPDGEQASPTHQHADDTTIHTETVEDAVVVLHEAVDPFCAASAAAVNLPKSWGQVSGTHPPLVGHHDASGVTFVAQGESVRHLGVPLVVGDPTQAVARLYRGKLQVVCGRVRVWSTFALTLKGRAHVAKQVLAPVLSYHATFLPVPSEVLERLEGVLRGYMYRNRLVEEGGADLRGRPAAVVASLPREMGGIAQVDVQAHVRALQAKVVAMLVHPSRRSWKGMFRARLQRAVPTLGLGALVHHPRGPASLPGLSSRQVAYVAAFRGLPLVRAVPHASMCSRQVALEGLVGNPSVCGLDGVAFGGVRALPRSLQGVATLGQTTAEQRVALKLPSGWEGLLAGAPPTAEWEVARQEPSVVRHSTAQGWSMFLIQPSGEMVPGCAPAPPQERWEPACVVHLPGDGLDTDRVPYLVGPWRAVSFDPSVWAVGAAPLLEYSVKEATAATLLAAAAAVQGAVPGRGVRPRLWGVGVAGVGDQGDALRSPSLPGVLQAMHDRQMVRLQSHLSAAGSSTGGGRVRAVDQSSQLYEASWMHPSPARAPVLQRVSEARAAVTVWRQQQQAAQQQVQGPLVDDTQWLSRDPVPWAAVWRRAHHSRLSRATSVFAWKLLHAALPVGGATIWYHAPGAPGIEEACCCVAPACRQQQPRPVESLCHLFWGCPVARCCLRWLAGLWGLLDPGGAVLPMDDRVWLADDASVWAPSRGHAALWGLLRLTMLRSIWVVRCSARGGSGVLSVLAVVSAFVREVRGLVLQDWARVEGDVQRSAGVPPSWLRGRNPCATLEQFTTAWCVQGVLARVVGPPGARPVLHVSLSTASSPGFRLPEVEGLDP